MLFIPRCRNTGSKKPLLQQISLPAQQKTAQPELYRFSPLLFFINHILPDRDCRNDNDRRPEEDPHNGE